MTMNLNQAEMQRKTMEILLKKSKNQQLLRIQSCDSQTEL